MLYQIFNNLWQLWWTLYLIDELNTPIPIVGLLATIQSASSILFIMGIAAAEAAIALSIIVAVFRRLRSINIERAQELRG